MPTSEICSRADLLNIPYPPPPSYIQGPLLIGVLLLKVHKRRRQIVGRWLFRKSHRTAAESPRWCWLMPDPIQHTQNTTCDVPDWRQCWLRRRARLRELPYETADHRYVPPPAPYMMPTLWNRRMTFQSGPSTSPVWMSSACLCW